MPSLPSNLYTGGAERFDSTPYVNFYAQTMARRQAKDEALDEYYKNQFKSINPAGMRTQDIPMFTEKVNQWQQFYQQNRDKIKNPRLDGGKAASEFQSRMQDALALTAQSKNEAKIVSDIAPLLRDPEKRSRIPDAFLQKLAIHDQPLGTPDRQSINLADLDFEPKPFDLKSQEAWMKTAQQGLKMDERITGTTVDPKTFTQTVTTTSEFGPEAKEAILKRSAMAYQGDPTIKHFVDTELSDPQKLPQLNTSFKKEYGRDIETPEDLMAAYTLGGIQQQQVKQKQEADWKARQDYLQGQRINLLNKRLAAEKAGKGEQEGWINEYIGVLKEQALSGPTIPYKYKSGKVVEEYNIPMDATLSKLLEKNKIQPDYLRYNPQTGQFRPIYAKYETVKEKKKDGTTEEVSRIVKSPSGQFAVDEELSQPISEPQLVLSLGGRVTPTQRTIEMKRSLELQKGANNKPFKIDGKTYNRKQLNDMGYDDDEIEQFIKSGVITQ